MSFLFAVEGGVSAKPEASNTEISKRNPKLLTERYERSHLAEFSHQQLSQPTVTDINKICRNYFTNWISFTKLYMDLTNQLNTTTSFKIQVFVFVFRQKV